jgi:hypothetical protein
VDSQQVLACEPTVKGEIRGKWCAQTAQAPRDEKGHFVIENISRGEKPEKPVKGSPSNKITL